MARLTRVRTAFASRRLRTLLGLGVLLVALLAGGLDVALTWNSPSTAAVALPVTTPTATPTSSAPTVLPAFISTPEVAGALATGNTCPTPKSHRKAAKRAADRCVDLAGPTTHKAKKTTTTH